MVTISYSECNNVTFLSSSPRGGPVQKVPSNRTKPAYRSALALVGLVTLTVGSGVGVAAASSTSAAPGVTKTSITVGQVDDLSSPLPGLFKSAQVGTQAYFNYINSQGGINGRKLVLDAQDSAFNSATVVSATQAQAKNDFALVGGYSLLDGSEAPIINASKIPDVTYPLSGVLANNSLVYSPSPSTTNDTPTGPYLWVKSKFPQQSKAIGSLYSAASPTNIYSEKTLDAAAQAQGLKFLYSRGFSVAESTFLSDVLKMKSSGVKMYFNQTIPGTYSATLAKETALEDFHPVSVAGIAAYIQNMASLSGGTANGMYLEQQAALFAGQDKTLIPEVALFDKWVLKIDPNVFSSIVPLTALDGWASGMLFAQALKAAGANPTRAGLITQLNKVTSFNAGGLLPPGENPAKNIPSKCFLVAQLTNGNWARIAPTKTGWDCKGGYYPRKGWSPQSR
jgi:ABC-type branched-subunit amino acid transport system substrate-binding protein